jgi:hypothetical protein
MFVIWIESTPAFYDSPKQRKPVQCLDVPCNRLLSRKKTMPSSKPGEYRHCRPVFQCQIKRVQKVAADPIGLFFIKIKTFKSRRADSSICIFTSALQKSCALLFPIQNFVFTCDQTFLPARQYFAVPIRCQWAYSARVRRGHSRGIPSRWIFSSTDIFIVVAV